MMNILDKNKYFLFTLVFLIVFAFSTQFYHFVKAANTSTVSISSLCSPTYYYADSNGKYIGSGKTLSPETNYQLKISWKKDTCKTVGSVQIGYIYTENGKTMQKLNTCIPSQEFILESGNKIGYHGVSGSDVKEGVKLRNYAFIGDSNSNCLNPPTTPREYVRTARVLEISTSVKNSTAGNQNISSDVNANTSPDTSVTGTSPDTGVTANVGDLDGNLGPLWNPLNFETVPQLIASLLRILFVLIGIAAVIIIIIAGFRMVLASGNEEELTKAKKAITWAIIGLIISLMSFSIVAIIERLIQVGA